MEVLAVVNEDTDSIGGEMLMMYLSTTEVSLEVHSNIIATPWLSPVTIDSLEITGEAGTGGSDSV